MNINLNIQAESPEELQFALTKLGGILTGSNLEQIAVTAEVAKEEPEKQEKPKRNAQKDTKPEKQADPELDQKSEQTEPEESPQESERIPTVVELRTVAAEKGKTPEGKKAVKEILDAFGSKSISDVPENQRAAFLKVLEAL